MGCFESYVMSVVYFLRSCNECVIFGVVINIYNELIRIVLL